MNFLRGVFGDGEGNDRPTDAEARAAAMASEHMGELPSRTLLDSQFNVLVVDSTTRRGDRDWASFFTEAATTEAKPDEEEEELKEEADDHDERDSRDERDVAFGESEGDTADPCEETSDVAEQAKKVRGGEGGQGLPVVIGGKKRLLRVFQAGWEDISVTSYGSVRKGKSEMKALCELAIKPRSGPSGAGHTITIGSSVTFRVDFVLIRNQVAGALPQQDFRNQLYALMHANVPSVNSLSSVYMFLERVIPFAELQRLRAEYGAEKFPTIEQTYYPTHREMLITPQYPLVVKAGHAHAGFGKMRLENHHDFADLRGLIAMTKFGCSAEPFLDGEYELRVQKIGDHVRVMKRIGLSGNWKTNTGAAIMEDVRVTEQYRLWAEKCGEMFGGLDILAVDALHVCSVFVLLIFFVLV
jgi:Synapsin, ATP binding domain